MQWKKYLNKDGKLFSAYYDIITENSYYTKIICEVTQLEKEITVAEFAENIANKYSLNYEEIVLNTLAFIECGFIITPSEKFYKEMQDFNPKVCKQKGCFYITGNKTNIGELRNVPTFNDAEFVKIYPELNDVKIINNICVYKRFLIPSKLKPEILEYLNKNGINEETLGLNN